MIPPRPLSPTRGGIRNLSLPVHFPRLEGGILSGNLEQVAIWAYLTLTLTLTLTLKCYAKGGPGMIALMITLMLTLIARLAV